MIYVEEIRRAGSEGFRVELGARCKAGSGQTAMTFLSIGFL